MRANKATAFYCLVLKKDVILVLPYLSFQSETFKLRLKSCVNKFYGLVNLRLIFQNTCQIKSFFPYKDRFNCSQKSKFVYKASCWDCDSFYIGKTKRRLHDRKIEHFKALTQVGHTSAAAVALTAGYTRQKILHRATKQGPATILRLIFPFLVPVTATSLIHSYNYPINKTHKKTLSFQLLQPPTCIHEFKLDLNNHNHSTLP